MKQTSVILAEKIAAAQGRFRGVALGAGAAWAVALFGAGLLLTALVDWRLDLPRGVRVAGLVIYSGVALSILLWKGFVPAARGVDEEGVALAVEQMDGRFSTRLIAAVQLGRAGALMPGESGAVVGTMIRETEAAAREVDFRRAIGTGGLRRAAITAAGVLAGAGLLYFAGGDHSLPLLRRALAVSEPWPSRTKVDVSSGSFLVAIGDPAMLKARATGYHPDSGVARITFASGRRQSITLSRVGNDDYAGTLENVSEPFSYSVQLYDSSSATFHVDAQARPVVTALVCWQIYPAYTGQSEARRDPADLILLTGSRLRLRMVVNRALRPEASRILFSGRANGPAVAAGGLSLQADPSDEHVWTAEFQPSAEVGGFSVHLVDKLGLESRSEPVFPIRLVADRAPTIHMLRPGAQQILATADATCDIGFTAEDDFGLARLSLHYRIDEEPEVIIPFAAPAQPREARQDYGWHLAAIAPPAGHPSIEGSVLDFYVEARDNNPGATGTAASEHYQIRVVSKADKQAELIARMAASFAGIQELSDKQSKAAADLRAAALQAPAATQTQPGGH